MTEVKAAAQGRKVLEQSPLFSLGFFDVSDLFGRLCLLKQIVGIVPAKQDATHSHRGSRHGVGTRSGEYRGKHRFPPPGRLALIGLGLIRAGSLSLLRGALNKLTLCLHERADAGEKVRRRGFNRQLMPNEGPTRMHRRPS